MKAGIVFDIKRFAIHDGPGIRTSVFFKGCPLKCWWCHNPEGINPHIECFQSPKKLDGKEFLMEKEVGRTITVPELMTELEKDRLIMEESGGGITFSGGEPLMQGKFLKSILKACNEQEFNTAVDTSGFAPQKVLMEIIPLTQLFLFDIKSLNPILHEKFTGIPIAPILSNFEKIIDSGVNIRLRIPVIPGFNFSYKDLNLYLNFILKYRRRLDAVHLLPFHLIAGNKYRKLGREDPFQKQTSLFAEDLKEWINVIEKTGVPVKTGG